MGRPGEATARPAEEVVVVTDTVALQVEAATTTQDTRVQVMAIILGLCTIINGNRFCQFFFCLHKSETTAGVFMMTFSIYTMGSARGVLKVIFRVFFRPELVRWIKH